jgi:hypothetical protein
MADYSDRFLADTYGEDEPVLFSAFTDRNRERTSVSMPESLFSRAIALGVAYQLNLLATLDVHSDTTLVKAQCATLLEEVLFIRTVVKDSLLQQHLGSLIPVLEKCVQTERPGAALLIEGP